MPAGFYPKNSDTMEQSLKVQTLELSEREPGFFSASGPSFSGPSLGAATNFAILASSAVTNTGSSVINGDVGVSPGTSITGFPPGVIVAGSKHSADAAAANAETAA